MFRFDFHCSTITIGTLVVEIKSKYCEFACILCSGYTRKNDQGYADPKEQVVNNVVTELLQLNNSVAPLLSTCSEGAARTCSSLSTSTGNRLFVFTRVRDCVVQLGPVV